MKLYILVRSDLAVSTGKLMVHVGHICTQIVYHYSRNQFIEKWVDDFHRIIILSVKDLEELTRYYYKWWAKPDRSSAMIQDAGFYEVPKGTILMCGIGPIFESEAKELGLNKLSLYKEPKKVSYLKKVGNIIMLINAKYLLQTGSEVKIKFEGHSFYLPKDKTKISGYDWYDLQEGALYKFTLLQEDWEKIYKKEK